MQLSKTYITLDFLFELLIMMNNRKLLSKLKNQPLSPLKIPKLQASYQTLLLDMMSKFYNQQKEVVHEQKITNKLLRKLVGEEDFHDPSEVSKHTEVHEHLIQYSKNSDFKEMKNRNQSQGTSEQVKNQYEDNSIFRQTLREYGGSYEEKNVNQLQNIADILQRVDKSLAKIPWKDIYQSSQFFKKQNTENPLAAFIKPSNIKKTSLKLIQENLFENSEGFNDEDQNKTSNEVHVPILQDFLSKAFIQNNQSLRKKSYNILSEILPYSDRREIKIRIPFDEFFTEENLKINVLQLTEEWLGTVYRATASICWSMLSNYVLSFDEVKILFNENIVFNFIEYMQIVKQKGYDDKRRAELARFINETSIKILEFLCKQYPLTKIEAPNIALRSKIRPINEKGKVQFDMVGQFCSDKSTNITLTKKASGLYTSDIMRCINQMIIKTQEEFVDFQKDVKLLFNEIFIPKDQREYARKDQKFLNNPRQYNQTYYEQVKSYTKTLISCKIDKYTEIYSEHEIQNGIFYVKSTSILRIITKWLESLQAICQKPQEQIKESKNQFKDHSGKYLYMDHQIRNQIYKQIKASQYQLKKKIQSIKTECYKMEVLLTEKQHTQDLLHSHLGEEQSSVGKYCTNLKGAISSYICSELNEIMDFLLRIPLKISPEQMNLGDKYYENQAKNDLKKLNLIYLKIFDLIRCKCISKESEITYLLERLYEKHRDKNDSFKIMRIKDRLSLGTRDLLLNVQFHPKGLVSEIQLGIISHSSDKRQELLDQYNHFLYELQRAQLGPLSQNASIWGALEQKATFFEAIKKQYEKRNIFRKVHTCVKKYDTAEKSSSLINFQPFLRPFICFSCENFFEIPRTCLKNVKCNQCDKNFCGECHLIAISEVSQILRKKFIFESNKFSHFLNYLTEYTDFKKPFPENGFIIRKNYLKKQLIYYRVIPKEIEGSKSSHEKQKYQIEMTSTVIQNQKIHYKIINKQQIFAIKKDSDYYILPNQEKQNATSYGQLSNLFIFSVNLKSSNIERFVSWAGLLQKCQSTMKIMNLIKSPIYTNDLKFCKMNKKDLEEMNASNNGCLSDQQFSFYLSGNKLILLEIGTDEELMRKSLQEKSNINKLVKLANQNYSTVDLQDCKMIDEITEQKLLPALKNNVLVFNQFYSNIKVLNLNFCSVITISFVSKMVNLEKLNVKGNQLKSLEGVENLFQLNFIRFSENYVTDLLPLEKLKQITYIGATKNQIKSLKGINNLKNLKSISVSANLIDQIDKNIENLNIEELYISENKELKQLQNLESLKSLKKIYFGNTQITNIDHLEVVKEKLEFLGADSLNLISIPPVINKLSQLLQLLLENCGISTIQNLAELKNLTFIDLRKNKISNMKPLENNLNLVTVRLNDNDIRDLTGIKSLKFLKEIQIKRNPLETFSDMRFLDIYFPIIYTGMQKDEERRVTSAFQNDFNQWKETKGVASVGSQEDEP